MHFPALLRVTALSCVLFACSPLRADVWVAGDARIAKIATNGQTLVTVDSVFGMGFGYSLGIENIIGADQRNGRVWVSDTNNNRVFGLNPDGTPLRQIAFSSPLGIGIDPNSGTVWTSILLDQATSPRAVIKLDPNTGAELVRVTGFSTLVTAIGVAPSGRVWIADAFNNQVVVLFGTDQELNGYDASAASGPHHLRLSGFAEPLDIAIDPGSTSRGGETTWVADRDHGQAVKLSPDGTELVRVNPTGFYEVRDVSVNSRDGSVWVGDGNSGRVAKLSASGLELDNLAIDPRSLGVDVTDGAVWIGTGLDAQATVLKLDSGGTQLLSIGGMGSIDGVAAILSPSVVNDIKLAPPRQISMGGTNNAVGEPLVGDFDNDGNTDLLVTVGLQPAPRHMNVLFGDGAGGFSIVQSNSISNAMSPLLVADVNGDGKSDVIMVTIGSSAGSDAVIGVFIGDGKGHFTAGAQYPVPYGTYQGVLGDFTNDGKLDFVLNVINEDPRATPAYEKQILFKGRGDGTFTTSALNLTSEAAIGNEALPLTGDFNRDGTRDLAFMVTDFPGPRFYMAYGHGDGTFSTPSLAYVADSAIQGPPAIADLDRDGKSDMVLSLAAKSSPAAQPRIASVLAKQTTGFYWKAALSIPWLGDAAVADLDGDGRPDLIAYGNQSTGSFPLYVWLYNGVGTGGVFSNKSVVDVSSISAVKVTRLLAVPLRRGDLPSLIVVDANQKNPLQLLVNITR